MHWVIFCVALIAINCSFSPLQYLADHLPLSHWKLSQHDNNFVGTGGYNDDPTVPPVTTKVALWPSVLVVHSSVSCPTERYITAARPGTTTWWRSVTYLWCHRSAQRSNWHRVLSYQEKWRSVYRMGNYHNITSIHGLALSTRISKVNRWLEYCRLVE